MTIVNIKTWLAVLCLSALVGCGGGKRSEAGEPLLGGAQTLKAADVAVTLSAAQIKNAGADTVTVTVTAVDANRAAVKGIPVILAVDSGATVRTSAAVTDANGQVTGTISIGEDKSNRVIKITARSGDIVREKTLSVTGAKLKATALPAALAPLEKGKVQFRLVDVNDNPIAEKQVTITGPDGVQSSGVTDISGDYEYSYTAPKTGGTIEIIGAAGGVETVAAVVVQATGGAAAVDPVDPISNRVQSSSLLSSLSVVPVNATGTSANRAVLRALFLGASNKPIKNIRVAFDLDGDRQSIGGTFTSGGITIYSDANGAASSAYIPGARFSAKDGVSIRACWDYKDFVHNPAAFDGAAGCPHATRTSLTVILDALSVSIGTNGTISSKDLTYIKQFVVQVVDSSGAAIQDIQISAVVDLVNYYKGSYTPGADRWLRNQQAKCPNEDINRNGVAETFSNGNFEDANGSFDVATGRPALDPRKGDVALSFFGSSKTNASGQVIVNLEYLQDVGSWVEFNLIVTAAGIGGTEGRANLQALLPVPADVVKNVDADPPFRLSPYGVAISAMVAVIEPEATRSVILLCSDKN